MLICKCVGVDDAQIARSIQAYGLRTREDVTLRTRAGGGCTSCHADIERLLALAHGGRAESEPPTEPAEPDTVRCAPDDLRLPVIQAVIARARPRIQADGGDVRLIAVDGDFIRVRLSGHCTHCAMAGQTLGGLRRELMHELKAPVRVVPG